MRLTGIEPVSSPWKGEILTIELQALHIIYIFLNNIYKINN